MNPLRTVSVVLLLSLTLGRAIAADPANQGVLLTPAEMEELVSPIALYPDPLVALILPASTFPSDIVLAARFLERGGLPEKAATEPWDDSIQALAHYREVIDYLDDNLEWTRRLGQCFLDQRDGVMDAVQTVRIRARAAGLLKDSPEQQVIVESEQIRIVPAEPTVIYVPQYDPTIFYQSTIPAYYGAPFITFGIGWGVGSWLNYNCDWYSHSVHVVSRPAYWYHQPDWHSHYRHTTYGVTPWTRRAPYPGQDRRIDHSPRHASNSAHGNDHRPTPRTSYYNGRTQNDSRPNNRTVSPTTQTQRSGDGNYRRRTETDRTQGSSLSPAATPVIPPVTTAESAVPRPTRAYRRPEAGTQSVADRRSGSSNNPERISRNQPTVRSAPSTSPNNPERNSRNQPTVRSTSSDPSSNPARGSRNQPAIRSASPGSPNNPERGSRSQPTVRSTPSDPSNSPGRSSRNPSQVRPTPSTASPTTTAPATASNARPAAPAPSPARRVEAPARTDDRSSDGQEQRATSRPSAGRGGNRQPL